MNKVNTPSRNFFVSTFLALAILATAFPIVPSLAAAPDNNVWTPQNSGMSGGNVASIAIDPNSSSTVYALTASNGMYKTTDAGANWTAINTGLPSDKSVALAHLTGNLLAMDPQDTDTLYANFGGKPFKTVDGGSNWTEISTGIDDCNGSYSIVGMAVDPQDSDHLFAGYIASGCVGGLYESLNGGTSWSLVSTSGIGNDAWVLAFDPVDSTRLYLATVHFGIAYSEDSGRTWTNTTPVGGDPSGSEVAVHPTSTNRVFYAEGSLGLYMSTDSGATWTSKTSEVPGLIYNIKFSESDPSVGYIAAATGVYKTENGGLDWVEVGDHATKTPKSIAINPENSDIVYLGSSGTGMYKSTNGGSSFSAINTGIPISIAVNATAIAPSDPDVYYATANGVGFFRSTDGGYNWVKMSSNIATVNQSYYILVSPTDPDTVYAGFLEVYKSTDGGANWTLTLDPPTDSYFQAGAIDPDNEDRVLLTENGNYFLWESSNAGSSWATSTTFRAGNLIYGMVFDEDDTDRVYAATYNYLWKSEDNGVNWENVSSTFTGANNEDLDAIAIDPTSPNILYAATRADRIMKSEDYGDTWANTNYSNSDASSPNTVKVNSVGDVYAFTLYSWQRSLDQGETWSEMATSGLTAAFYLPKHTFKIDPQDDSRFFLGNSSGGFNIYENYIPDFASSDIAATPDLGGTTSYLSDIFTATATITNDGPASAASTTVNITLPGSLGYVLGSSVIDGSPAGDPDSVSDLEYGLGTLLRGQTATVSFKFSPNQNSGTLSSVVTSHEDVSGTSLGSVTISALTPEGSSGGDGGSGISRSSSGSSSGSSSDTDSTTPTTPGTLSESETRQALQNQISSLLAQIEALRQRLGLPSSTPGTPSTPGGFTFTRDLTIGATGEDVRQLQIFLNTNGFVLASTGPGSPGNETTTFGALTQSALAKFQADKGISPASGYFGPLTRAYVNGL